MSKHDMILAAALRMFAEKGFTATSTAALAREAGVAEGTIFRHFESKETIFSEILAALRLKIVSDFENEMTLAGGENGLKNMRHGIASFLTFCASNRDYLALFFNDAPARYNDRDKPVFREIYSIYRYITEFLVLQAVKGQADGSVRPDIDVLSISVTLTCSIIGLARARHFGLIESAQIYVDQLLDNIERILTV